jgi:cysteine desulfurase/selenocysteine lyase
VTPVSLENLLNDEALRRREFPVCEKSIFLAHAGVSPLPRRVAEAMRDYLDSVTRQEQDDERTDRIVAATRRQAARLVEAGEDEIAFVGSTSMGLSMVAAGLPWQAGDNVVCYRDDFPSNVFPWMELARRGVEVRSVEPRQYGNVTVGDLERVVDAKTRLVSLSSVHFVAGWRLNVDAVGRFLGERRILFCLDAIQSLGALKTSMRHVDFAAADAHKWMLGPLGAAILYVRKEHFDLLRPALVGWHSAPSRDYIAPEKLTFWPSARRYEPGSGNLAGIIGLHAALELILGLSIESIERRVLALSRRTIAEATESGFSVVGPNAGAGLSGIVSFIAAKRDLAQLHRRLLDAGIVTSLRRRRDGSRCLRVSAHFYNSEEEIERLGQILREK